MIYSYKDCTPDISKSVFIAPNATIIGDIVIGEESSIWFNVVVRGDVNSVRIGSRTNIQDSAALHVTYQKAALNIGNNVTVGHAAILHGCSIEDHCLIGMGARILDGARIGRNCLVAAGALILQGDKVSSNSLVAGVPAIVKRSLTDEEIAEIQSSADRYVKYSATYLNNGFQELNLF